MIKESKTKVNVLDNIEHQEKMNAVEFIEANYPETAHEFQRLQDEQYAMFCRKQMDYGPSNISMGTSLVTDDERRISLVGLIVRMNDKIQRLAFYHHLNVSHLNDTKLSLSYTLHHSFLIIHSFFLTFHLLFF